MKKNYLIVLIALYGANSVSGRAPDHFAKKSPSPHRIVYAIVDERNDNRAVDLLRKFFGNTKYIPGTIIHTQTKSTTDKKIYTLLGAAVEKGLPKTVNYLLQKRARVEEGFLEGDTNLMWDKMVNGLRPPKTTKFISPLILAINSSHTTRLEIVKTLLHHNALLDAIDYSKRMPLDLAYKALKTHKINKQAGQVDIDKKIIKLLKAHGAK